jgi:hypothetical protein
LRCLGRGSGFRWPSPGVFSVTQIAEKILIDLAGQGLVDSPPELLSTEELVLGLWVQESCSLPLEVFSREMREALKLAPLGLSAGEWIALRSEIENPEKTNGELRVWSERIYLYVQALAFAANRARALTRWDNVSKVVMGLETKDLERVSWIKIFERHPFDTEKLSLTVCEVQDPQPLEDAFLRMLPIPVTRMRQECSDEKFPLAGCSRIETFEDIRDADDLAFAWAFDASVPGPVEAVIAVPGNFPIDVTLRSTEDDNEELRLLALYCDALSDPKNLQHPFHRHAREARFLNEWKLAMIPLPQASNILHAWRTEREVSISPLVLECLELLSLKNLGQAFAFLAESQLFAVERSPFSDARLDPRGAPLVTLVDLPFMGARRFALWGIEKDFEKYLSPTSTSVLRKQDFPASFRKILEGQGHWIPDPEREQRALLGALSQLGDALVVMEPRPLETFTPSPAPEWTVGNVSERKSFSPSALEAYAECSLRYYVERVLRPGRVLDWDPIPMDSLLAGQWVHAILEEFLQAPDWVNPAETLERIIEKHRKEIFLSAHSDSYDKILIQEAFLLKEKLVEHLTDFEKPLLDLMGTRVKLETETLVEGSFEGRSYHGKLDRLDHYPNQKALLWDYKTGTLAQTSALKQIENNKFQWHLYRSLLESGRPSLSIVGGGYLNPLDPSKSRLILFAELLTSAELAGLEALCLETGHALEIIETSQALSESLTTTISALRLRLDEGLVAPDGNPKKACPRCSLLGLCGKPYLEGEPVDVLA